MQIIADMAVPSLIYAPIRQLVERIRATKPTILQRNYYSPGPLLG